MDAIPSNPTFIQEFQIYPLDGELVLALGLFCLNALGYWIFITYLQSKSDCEDLLISKLRYEKMSNLKVIKIKRMHNGKTDQENLDSILKHLVQTKASIKRYDFDVWKSSLSHLCDAIPVTSSPLYTRSHDSISTQKASSGVALISGGRRMTRSYDKASTPQLTYHIHHPLLGEGRGATSNESHDVLNIVIRYCPYYLKIKDLMQECIDQYTKILADEGDHCEPIHQRTDDLSNKVMENENSSNTTLSEDRIDRPTTTSYTEDKKKLLGRLNEMLFNKDKRPVQLASSLQKGLNERIGLDRESSILLRSYYVDFCDQLSLCESIMQDLEDEKAFKELLSRLKVLKTPFKTGNPERSPSN